MAKKKGFEQELESLAGSFWSMSRSELTQKSEAWLERWSEEAYQRAIDALSGSSVSIGTPADPSDPWSVSAWLRRLEGALSALSGPLSSIQLKLVLAEGAATPRLELYGRALPGPLARALAERLFGALQIRDDLLSAAAQRAPELAQSVLSSLSHVDTSALLRERETHPLARLLEGSDGRPDDRALDALLSKYAEDIFLSVPSPTFESPEDTEPRTLAEWLQQVGFWLEGATYPLQDYALAVHLVLRDGAFVPVLAASIDAGDDEYGEDEEQEQAEGEEEQEEGDSDNFEEDPPDEPVPLTSNEAVYLARRIVSVCASEALLSEAAALIPQMDPETLRYAGNLFIPNLPPPRYGGNQPGEGDPRPAADAPLVDRVCWLANNITSEDGAEGELIALLDESAGELVEQIGDLDPIGSPDDERWPNQAFRITDKAWKRWLSSVDEVLYSVNANLEPYGLSLRIALDTSPDRFGPRFQLSAGDYQDQPLQSDVGRQLGEEICRRAELPFDALDALMRNAGERLERTVQRLGNFDLIAADE